VIRSTIIPMS